MPTTLSWLLILAFPHGGSTALAKLLATAPGAVELNDRAEGQWLVPGMCVPQKRWDPHLAIDWDDVRRRWTDEARARAADIAGPALVVEKSPPNMCRYRPLLAALGGSRTTMAVMTRDPFATCARWHHSIGRDAIAQQWGLPRDLADEGAYFAALADIWLRRAAMLDAARDDAAEMFRYEDFADDPAGIVGRLAARVPLLAGATATAPVVVKSYRPQPVRNMNADDVAALTKEQREALGRRLQTQAGLVERLGYETESPDPRPS